MTRCAAPNPAEVYIGTLSTPASRRTARGLLNGLAGILSGGAITFAEEFPWPALRYRDTQALRRELVARYQPRGVNLRLSMLRRVLEESHALGLIRGDDYQRAARLRNVRGDRGLRGRSLEGTELSALVAACKRDPVPRGARDAALVGLLAGTAARRHELARLDLPGSVDLERALLSLETKGNRTREIEILPAVEALLRAWIAVRGSDPGPLFVSIDRLGRFRGRLSPGGIAYMLHRRALEAGIRDCTPHDLRRTFTTRLLDAGAELHVAQEILDHADLATTARYDVHRGHRRRAALERLRLPF